VSKANYNTRNVLPANILQNDSVNVIVQHIATFIILKYMILIPADDVYLQLHTTGSRFFFLQFSECNLTHQFCAVNSSIFVPKIIAVYSENLLKLTKSLSLSLSLSLFF
jgi:hypothetical protein